MSNISEGDEVFFDTSDYLMVEDSSVGKGNRMCTDFDYDVWLKEPGSVNERRDNFFSAMGFVECCIAAKSEATGFDSIATTLDDGVEDNMLLSERRKSHSEANCSIDYSDHDWLDDIVIDTRGEESTTEHLVAAEQCEMKQVCAGLGVDQNTNKKKAMNWWRNFARRMKKGGSASSVCKKMGKAETMARMRVEPNRKQCVECSGVYARQEVKAHNGLIWTMKFSPDGQYLATGGEDGIVCIWRISMVDGCCKTDKCAFGSLDMSNCRKKLGHASIIIPEKIFQIEEEPLQKLYGHCSDVLDLAWSTSNHLLSSSMDKTVRLWRAGEDKCLGVFRHSNYVTCVQFNPVDENQFISGCIDGKVRIWGIQSRRVQDWANAREVVTAVCYQPDGKGFIVGSVSGTCRFYGSSSGEDDLLLKAEIKIHGRRKSSGYRITGIQFLKNDSRRVMVTSEDSRIRILDGIEVVRKYKGLTKSGSQMSASFTSSGRHIVSVGDGSRIYLWNHDDLCIQTPKQAKSTRSCEHFLSEGVSVALPWSSSEIGPNDPSCNTSPSPSPSHVHQESSLSKLRDSDRFSLANWFSMDSSTRAVSTWPEEKLPLWDLPSAEYESQPSATCSGHLHQQQPPKSDGSGANIASKTWGLVFVTGDRDGMIKTFHNYGLPVRV